MTTRDETVQTTTFAIARTVHRAPSNVEDGVTVELDTTDERSPITLVVENGTMFAATSASNSAAQAYGIGARLTVVDVRRLAQALTEAADEVERR